MRPSCSIIINQSHKNNQLLQRKPKLLSNGIETEKLYKIQFFLSIFKCLSSECRLITKSELAFLLLVLTQREIAKGCSIRVVTYGAGTKQKVSLISNSGISLSSSSIPTGRNWSTSFLVTLKATGRYCVIPLVLTNKKKSI